ncbi:MAG: branched-chain amino acid ABC transporter permease, partial [Candidatus Competibacteraceae bacterium]|nr:branched-chain amino acid ABC transporter permease [Candidatus Competibacteraceae bacterium]
LMGININRAVMLAFGLGGGLAAVAGLFWGGKYGQIDPLMGFIPGLKAFIATVIGGVGSIPGALLGGYILGLAEVLFVGLLPSEYAGYRDAFVFGLLILVLLVKPNGLLGVDEGERA